jgi:type IV fimbrial biogenesis protein FimT
MITLFIVGILLTVGVPSLKAMMQGNQLVATSNELVSALHIARSEAIKLNKKVTICISSDGQDCLTNTNKWQKGWIIFIDANEDQDGTGANCKQLSDISSDCLLRVHSAVNDSKFSVTGTYDSTGSDIQFFTFTSRGLPKDNGASTSGALSVCSYDDSNNVIGSRAVVLSLSGRVRVSDNSAVINCPSAP